MRKPPKFTSILGIGFFLITSSTYAWEVANTDGRVSVNLIGQSFAPPIQDDGDDFFLPRSSHGLAYLESLSFVLANEQTYPNEVYIHAEEPAIVNGVISTSDRLGTLTGGAFGYFPDAPLAVPYDQLLYLVFPNCVLARAELFSYSSGFGLRPEGGCPAGAGSQPIRNDAFSIDFSVRFLNPLAPLAADYRLDQQNLGSFLMQAPAMTDLGTNGFIQDNVLGQTRSVLEVLEGTGVEIDLASTLSQQSYSIVILVRADNVEGPSKLIDLSLLGEDDGLYISNQALDYRGSGIAPSAQLVESETYVQIALSHSESTQGFVRAFVNDQDALDFFNANNAAVRSRGSAIVLRDEADENTAGALARVRVFDGRLTPEQLKILHPFPPETLDIYEPDNGYFESDIGITSGNFSSFRTFHSSSDEDWIFVDDPCNNGNFYSSQGGLALYSDDPRFQPIVEVYRDSLLVDPNAAPRTTFGRCGDSNELYFRPPIGHVRIRNCPSVDLANGPVSYTFVPMAPDFAVCGPAATIRGTVIDSATGSPVGGQFILSNGSSTTVSNPATGAYSLAVTGGDIDLNVVSPLWQGNTVEVFAEPLETYEGVDLLVTRSQPDAQDDGFTTDEDVSLNGDVSINDLPSGDGPNNYSVVNPTSLGSIELTLTGEFSYSPNPNANGGDSFTYQITDQSGDTNTATVAIDITPINDAPVANNDSASVNQNSAAIAIDVLANDADPDGNSLTISSVTQPPEGLVEIASDGRSLSYRPNAEFCAGSNRPDQFVYRASDGLINDEAQVSVVVICLDELIFSNGFEN